MVINTEQNVIRNLNANTTALRREKKNIIHKDFLPFPLRHESVVGGTDVMVKVREVSVLLPILSAVEVINQY